MNMTQTTKMTQSNNLSEVKESIKEMDRVSFDHRK